MTTRGYSDRQHFFIHQKEETMKQTKDKNHRINTAISSATDAAKRERKNVRLDGAKAYERPAFQLMK